VIDTLAEPRRDHNATLLRDGRVLITGGTARTRTAEVFDPSSETFSVAGTMVCRPGQGQTATRLFDGRVLVAGGIRDPTCAEVFDAEEGRFTATGALNTPHSYHAATLLDNGDVLIMAGQNDARSDRRSHAVIEIYDSQLDRFRTAGTLRVDRFGHGAWPLPGGRVLVVGGMQSTTPGYGDCLRSTETYERDGQTSQLGSPMVVERCDPLVAPLRGGAYLIVGWTQITAEVYSAESETFEVTGAMAVAHLAGTATALSAHQVLVAGGITTGDDRHTTRACEIYDAPTERFVAVRPMGQPRHGHAAVLLDDGRVLVTGGTELSGDDFDSAELYVRDDFGRGPGAGLDQDVLRRNVTTQTTRGPEKALTVRTRLDFYRRRGRDLLGLVEYQDRAHPCRVVPGDEAGVSLRPELSWSRCIELPDASQAHLGLGVWLGRGGS
jgi:hypothetical protein